MTPKSVILKLEHTNESQPSFEGMKIRKINSSISPATLITLIKNADNQINPRTATVNSITRGIYETLEKSPELFWYKSKGILLATENCQKFDRNRVKMTFENPEYEGIMDGGHNTFAIARYIVDKLFGVSFKNWDECKAFWKESFDLIKSNFDAHKNDAMFRFSIPVEIIFPEDNDEAREEYYASISEICSARNNNIQLKETARGNQVGCYDYLKALLPDYSIKWKTGEAGEIKSEDVIAMADIPLYFLQSQGLLPKGIKKFNPVNLYSGKGQCVTFFNELIKNEEISTVTDGKYIIHSGLVKSALDMTEDIMRFFDLLYVTFPSMYNDSGRFGSISAVKAKSPSKPLFGTMDVTCEYTYPDGFIYPIVGGLTGLMAYDSETDTIKWKVNPMDKSFNIKLIPLKKYMGWLKKDLDPQHNGKNRLMYEEAEEAFRAYAYKQKGKH